jgi:hypothetical protein
VDNRQDIHLSMEGMGSEGKGVVTCIFCKGFGIDWTERVWNFEWDMQLSAIWVWRRAEGIASGPAVFVVQAAEDVYIFLAPERVSE